MSERLFIYYNGIPACQSSVWFSSIHSPIQAFIHSSNGFYFCVALSLQMKEQRRWQNHSEQNGQMFQVDKFGLK